MGEETAAVTPDTHIQGTAQQEGKMVLIWLKDCTACSVLHLLSAPLKTQRKEAEL